KKLSNTHYKAFFTEQFELDDDYYNGKVIVDIGCGPRGSLEWADMTKDRIGLDPLADQYLKLGADKHQMKYVNSYVENMPFENASCDLISSFNSLDHVKNLANACKEIDRVLKPGGIFLLIVDIHRFPTLTEPQTFGWIFVKEYFPSYEILEEKHLKTVKPNRIYSNVRENKILEENEKNWGVLKAKLKKPIQ
ncbi:MAG: class I SAM-dependent methyltransferase, partial [Ignavibacteria bacterium]|nr:class I SAM-dependent methyltransferase [Ignavibacteria bacterium]